MGCFEEDGGDAYDQSCGLWKSEVWQNAMEVWYIHGVLVLMDGMELENFQRLISIQSAVVG